MERVETVTYPSLELAEAPFGYLRDRQAEAGVFKVPDRDEWIVTRHADVVEVLRNPDVFSNEHSMVENGVMRAAVLADLTPARISNMVGTDPPAHTWKRALAFEDVKPARLKEHRVLIQAHVTELIDGFVNHGEVEFVSGFASQLPPRVIADIMGFAPEHYAQFVRWGAYEGHGTRFLDAEQQDEMRGLLLELVAFVQSEVIARVEAPRDDVLSRFIARHAARPEGLQMGHVIADAANMLIGGIVTTAHLIASTMVLLLDHPAQLEAVRVDRSLIPGMVEESVRLESPVPWQPRLVKQDAVVGGIEIPAGAIILLCYAAANRDPQRFETPEAFDVRRRNVKQHLGFGLGLHFCIGAPLARLEAQIAFDSLFDRLTDLRYAASQPPLSHIESLTFRGPQNVRVAFERA
jgi:cytochrome P450